MWLILSAMPEESAALAASVGHPSTLQTASREVTLGTIGSQPVAVAFSRWGKVAAASTAAHLITRLQPSAVVFTGIAGALVDGLGIGDVVLARHLFHHDLDASPFFAPTEIPLMAIRGIPVNAELTGRLRDALSHPSIATAGRAPRRVHEGDIATGDQVIGTAAARERILRSVPSALCVEMEGAAVAQVCHEFGVPFACMRLISDRADESLAPEEVFRLARHSGGLAAEMLRVMLTAE